MSNTENTKRGRGRPRKETSAKLSSLKQAHGKDETTKKFKPMTMEQVWGGDGTGKKYSTLDSAKYQEELASLTRTDLHRHATKIGLVPVDNLNLLKKRLVLEHKRYCSAFKYPEEGTMTRLTPEELLAMEKRVREIMG